MKTQEQFYKAINPYSADAKNMKVRTVSIRHKGLLKDFPNFSKTGSIAGMKKKYYGKGALLVRCGNYIYNVSSDPQIYYQYGT